MANLLKLLGIPYLVGKIKFKLFFSGPLAKWDNGFFQNDKFIQEISNRTHWQTPKQLEYLIALSNFLEGSVFVGPIQFLMEFI